MTKYLTILLLATLLSCFTTFAQQPARVKVVVYKQARSLALYQGGRVTHRFKVCLGDEPVGHKNQQGDERTPEGTYKLYLKNPNSNFYKSFLLDYPNKADRARAKRLGVKPGNFIALHGTGSLYAASQLVGYDWTDGCIAVTDAEIDTLWKYIPVGTAITIHP